MSSDEKEMNVFCQESRYENEINVCWDEPSIVFKCVYKHIYEEKQIYLKSCQFYFSYTIAYNWQIQIDNNRNKDVAKKLG